MAYINNFIWVSKLQIKTFTLVSMILPTLSILQTPIHNTTLPFLTF